MENQAKKPVEKVKGKRGRKPRQTPYEVVITLINKLESFDDLDKLAEEVILIRDSKKQAEIDRLTSQLEKLKRNL